MKKNSAMLPNSSKNASGHLGMDITSRATLPTAADSAAPHKREA